MNLKSEETKSEIRNPKSEGIPKPEYGITKKQTFLFSDFGFGFSDFLRISDFGFRIWFLRIFAKR